MGRGRSAFRQGRKFQHNLMLSDGWTPPPPDGGISQEHLPLWEVFIAGLLIGLIAASVIWCLWGRQLMSILGGQYG